VHGGGPSWPLPKELNKSTKTIAKTAAANDADMPKKAPNFLITHLFTETAKQLITCNDTI